MITSAAMQKHLASLDLLLSDYREGAKSKHWQKFYTDSMVERLRSGAIETFRCNRLNADLEQNESWVRTASDYKRLLAVTGPEWIDNFSETNVGAPETHKVRGKQIRHHELVLCEYLWKINHALKNYDFVLLPDWLSGQVSDACVDLVVNTRSMMEMNLDTIGKYFSDLQRWMKVGGIFYNVNRYAKFTVGVPIRLRDYPYDNRWTVEFSRPSFFQPHVHELMTRRSSRESSDISQTLAALPETDPHRAKKRVSLLRKLALLLDV